MPIKRVENNQKLEVGHAGLTFIQQMVEIIELEKLAQSVTIGNPVISTCDVLTSMLGLLSQGKTDYAHIEEFKGNKFFMNVLGLKQVPSEETYRQRFKAIATNTDLASLLPTYSVKLYNRLGMEPVVIEKDGQQWIRVDVDPVIYDNSDTKKEGATYTYDKQFGYAAIFAHFDGGWMINAQLNPGNTSFHGQDTIDFVNQSLDLADKMSLTKKLLVTDCGLEDQQFLEVLLARENTDCIIKHNKRRESSMKWLEVAKTQGRMVREDKAKGYRIYQGSTYRQLKSSNKKLRLVFEVREIFKKNGRNLLIPEVKLFSVWTSIECFSEQEILRLYRLRGTSEQYHAEFKSEMNMERPPSDNLQVNKAFVLMGMLAHNMLKAIALDMVKEEGLGLKQATRRRIRTVMHSVIFMAGRIVRGSRYQTMQLGCPKKWFHWFDSLFQRLNAV